MTAPEPQPSPAALAAALADAGELTAGTPLAAAFAAVDRGAFVPACAVYTHTAQGVRYRLVDGADPAQRAEWARRVYADQTLIIEIDGRPVREALPGGTGTGRWTSSSTLPSLMARHLDALDLHEGLRVLEIGVGSGYNAALLAHLVGDDRVTSVDISPALVDAARAALAAQDVHPVLVAGDGRRGHPGRAPFDRIIATAAFDHVPPAWIEQAAPGGIVLLNLAGGTGGAVARLEVKDGTAQGRFMRQWAGFMGDRSTAGRRRTAPVEQDGDQGWTALDPATVHGAGPRAAAGAFLAQLATTDARTVLATAADGTALLVMEGADGSWADVELEADPRGRRRVTQAGPRRLWDRVEQACAWWEKAGYPDWSAFGVTATTSGEQWVWHAWPDSADRWPLAVPGTAAG